jgi:hypothetical protein
MKPVVMRRIFPKEYVYSERIALVNVFFGAQAKFYIWVTQ